MMNNLVAKLKKDKDSATKQVQKIEAALKGLISKSRTTNMTRQQMNAANEELIAKMNCSLDNLMQMMELKKIKEEQERLRKIQEEMERERKRKEEEERKRKQVEEERKQKAEMEARRKKEEEERKKKEAEEKKQQVNMDWLERRLDAMKNDEEVIAHRSTEACSETSSDAMVHLSMRKLSELQDTGDTTQHDSPGENAICVGSSCLAAATGATGATVIEEVFVSLCMETLSSMIISSIHLVRRIYRGKSIFPLARSTPRPSWVVPQHERRNMTEKDYEDWILRGEISDTEGKGNWKRREYEKYITEDSPIHLSGGKGSDKENTGKVLHSGNFYQVISSGQNVAYGTENNIHPNKKLTTDEATENISIEWNEDSSARKMLFSCCHQDIKEIRSKDNLLPMAQTKDPEDGTVDDRDVIKVLSACDMPADNTQAKDFCTIFFKESISFIITCSQYERDDASGILDGKEQSESVPTNGEREDCNRCTGHENEINEVNDNMIVDNKHQKDDCLFTSTGTQKAAENQTEETDARVWEIIDRKDSGYNSLDDNDSSTDESLDENEIEDNVIERKENDKTVCDGVFGSQGLISQREDTQISIEIEEFRPIGNRLHLLRYKILDHKPVKSLKSQSKFLPVENLQIRDTQSREKLSCEKPKKDKYTYMHKMLHHVSFLPVPNLEIAVFKNESAKFFEPVLGIVNLIADGNDPGPQVTMQYELLRICTLRNYPKDNKPFLIHFAKAGFYYAAEGDEVICYCCGLRRHSWLVTDVPYRIHQRINPNCKFLNRNPEFNVPIVYTGTTKNLDKLEMLLIRLEEENKSPQATTDAEGGNDLSEYVPPQALSGALNNPKHRQYVSKTQRLSSYEGWPDNLIQTPEIMAEAGFYYAGFGDCVRCYYCGIGLRHWTAEDNVWIEHARWSKHCAFLKQEKGQEFINLVHMAIKYTQDDDEQPVIEASNPDDKEAPKNGLSEQGLVDKILLTDPAQSVLEMGYTPKIIKKAIAFILNRDGRSGISSQTIMEKVLEFEEAENAKTLAGELANMDLGRQDNSTGGPNSGSSRKSSQKSALSKTAKVVLHS